MADDRITEFIRRLRREADSADFSVLAETAIRTGSRRPGWVGRLRTRTAAAVAATVVSVGTFGGVAYAADGASPGDFLYGLDRALEAVGIGNGGGAERIAEAIVLTDQGDPGEGLEHAASAVSDDPGAESALLAAAERLTASDGPEVHDQVAALLTYLADNIGSVDGQAVAELAQAVHGGPGGPPDGVPGGPPDGVPGGPPDGVPGGPPDGVPGGPPDGIPGGPHEPSPPTP